MYIMSTEILVTILEFCPPYLILCLLCSSRVANILLLGHFIKILISGSSRNLTDLAAWSLHSHVPCSAAAK